MEKKFRMYSGPKVNKYFHDQAQVLECMTQQVSGFYNHEKEDGAKFEQWTGLHDSTTWQELSKEKQKEWLDKDFAPSQWIGFDLYENDVLTCDGNYAVISFENGIFGYHWIGSEFYHALSRNLDDMKLAGNSNQHKELLKKD